MVTVLQVPSNHYSLDLAISYNMIYDWFLSSWKLKMPMFWVSANWSGYPIFGMDSKCSKLWRTCTLLSLVSHNTQMLWVLYAVSEVNISEYWNGPGIFRRWKCLQGILRINIWIDNSFFVTGNVLRTWDGWAGKRAQQLRNTDCSSRGSEFSSQHPCGSSQLGVTLILGDLVPSFGFQGTMLSCPLYTGTHVGKHLCT